MDTAHPLGAEFSRWVALTDEYAERLRRAMPGEFVDTGALEHVAAELQALREADDSR